MELKNNKSSYDFNKHCHIILKSHDIQNTSFMDYTKDPLYTMDPWIDCEVIEDKIIQKCRENVWYFFDKVFRIPTPDGPMPLIMDPAKMQILYLYQNNQNSILMDMRQAGGKSTFLIGLFIHSLLKNVENPNVIFGYMSPMKSKLFPSIEKFIESLYLYIPSFIVDILLKNSITGRIATTSHEIPNTRRDILFMDDFMYIDNKFICGIEHVLKSDDKIICANGVIGPRNADILAEHSILFNIKNLDSDILEFSNVYRKFTGYKPIFRVHLDPEELVPVSEIERQKVILLRNPELIRKDIQVRPNWKM